ncbi:MAG: rhodanese-like domain-containing protein [Nitrososphaerales archaeon]
MPSTSPELPYSSFSNNTDRRVSISLGGRSAKNEITTTFLLFLKTLTDVTKSLKGRKGQSSQIVDARNPGEYDGKYRRALKSGSVPGSVNVEWKLALRRDGTLRDVTQLRK